MQGFHLTITLYYHNNFNKNNDLTFLSHEGYIAFFPCEKNYDYMFHLQITKTLHYSDIAIYLKSPYIMYVTDAITTFTFQCIGTTLTFPILYYYINISNVLNCINITLDDNHLTFTSQWSYH